MKHRFSHLLQAVTGRAVALSGLFLLLFLCLFLQLRIQPRLFSQPPPQVAGGPVPRRCLRQCSDQPQPHHVRDPQFLENLEWLEDLTGIMVAARRMPGVPPPRPTPWEKTSRAPPRAPSSRSMNSSHTGRNLRGTGIRYRAARSRASSRHSGREIGM